MLEFISVHWAEILLSLVTAGLLAACKGLHSMVKRYHKLLEEKQEERSEEAIDRKIEPIIDELENLRQLVMELDHRETHHIRLIADSYCFQLVKLCKQYIKQQYISQAQSDQLIEFYRIYTEMGGGREYDQVKIYYDKVMNLPIREITE